MNSFFYKNIQFVKGIGAKRSQVLNKHGIFTVKDLLFNFPRDYEDRRTIAKIRNLQYSGKETIFVEVVDAHFFNYRFRKKGLKIIFTDETGLVSLTFFNSKQVQYYGEQFKRGLKLFLTGKFSFSERYNEIQVQQYDFEFVSSEDQDDALIHSGRIVPLYTAFSFITSKNLRKSLFFLIEQLSSEVQEYMPKPILESINLISLVVALKNIHFPENFDILAEARRRLAFDRLFFLELFMQIRKKDKKNIFKSYEYNKNFLAEKVKKNLPFELTQAQNRVLTEIYSDLRQSYPMTRLLQGDVGAGKTVVALLALLLAVENGYQTAIMAPTEILAEQHFRTIQNFLKGYDVSLGLLLGRMKKKEKETLLAKIKLGEINIVIGTHALIQENVQFKKLSLVVIDEQHKFGVEQRKALLDKGLSRTTDLLVMTATPIPRTLSLTVYGDLELSIIDQLPPNRKPVITKWFREKDSEKLYTKIRGKLAEGEKVYFVYPLVQESETLDLKNVLDMYELFSQSVFHDFGVGLIHGKMKGIEKEKAMQNFKEGKTQVLVATTVVEVGVDVPDATIIVIEHAERFGLAQLHQLRGRIGRGEKQSFCFLLTSDRLTDEGRLRMKVMQKTSDGFRLAEADLSIRGPGELIGTRQSGLPDLRPADIVKDGVLLEEAKKIVEKLLEKKFDLSDSQRYLLYAAYKKEVQEKYYLIKVG